MAHLFLSLFGGFSVMLEGKPVSGFNSNKVRALLAYLAVEADHPHRRETLAALLWPEYPERLARTNMRNALANLRKVLDDSNVDQPFLLVTRETLQFNRASDADLDVSAFLTLTNTESPALQQLEDAVALYQGSFLQGFSLRDSLGFDDWSLIMRERLHRKVLSALRQLSTHYARQGDYIRACEVTRQQVELEPWNEEAHRDLMRLLAVSGQRSQALAQYETCCQVLDAELGVAPSRETEDIYEQIRDGRLVDLHFPTPESQLTAPTQRHNLPLQLTPFVGRKGELASIADHLKDPSCRLLSLVGPGGCGKTRLAIEVGNLVVDRFKHGVFLVSLASLNSTDSLLTAMASALDFSFYQGVEPQQQILKYLREKNMLLIFDNFEHLLPPPDNPAQERSAEENATTFVLDIVKNAPDVRIMITSRARLNVQSEVLFPVSGMAVPETIGGMTTEPTTQEVIDVTQYSAIELFVLSARRVCPGFSLTKNNQKDVVRICHLVNGLPLGILLASAWTYMLSPADIAAQIQQSFDFLETDSRDLPERQRSLRSVFNHSRNLLSPREREILSALSVFKGETSRTAVMAVTGATLRELRSLMDKSLLHMNANGYYEVHELIRQYAAEKLNHEPDAGDRLRDRHSIFYLTALEQWCESIKGPTQESALNEMSIEIENIRQAWMRALDQKWISKLDQASYGLAFFFMNYRLFREGERWFRASLEHIESFIRNKDIDDYIKTNAEEIRVYTLIISRYVFIDYWTWGRSNRVCHNIEKSRSLLEKLESAKYDIRQDRADFIYNTADAIDSPKQLMIMEMLDINRELGNKWGTALALHELGWCYWMLGNYQEAERSFRQGIAFSRELGAPRLIAALLKALVYTAWESGKYDLACYLCEEELARRQTLLRNAGMENVLQAMALITSYQGKLDKAEYYAHACITLSKEINSSFHTEVGLRRLGLMLMAAGRYIEAISAFSESVVISGELGQRYDLTSSVVRLAETKLHLGQYEEAYHQVQECLNLAQVLDAQRNISFFQLLLGRLALVKGELQEAIVLHKQGIDILQGMGPRRELGPAYADLCIASLRLGDPIQAKQYLHTALDYAVKTGDYVAHVYVLPIAALFFANQGQIGKASDLFTMAFRYPMVANSHWFADILSNDSKVIEMKLPQEVMPPDEVEAQLPALHTKVNDLLAELV